MNVNPGQNLPLVTGLPDLSGNPLTKRGRDYGLLRFGLLFSLLTALLAFGAFSLVKERITTAHAMEETQSQMALQHATDALADKARSLFGSQEQLVRLASLELRLTDCCDKAARDVADAGLVEAVRQNPLGLQALLVREAFAPAAKVGEACRIVRLTSGGF